MEIVPVTKDRWDDLVDLFERKGPRGGTPVTDGCWCMWWRRRTGSRDRNREAMERIVREGREPGLLAYLSDAPVGWVSVAPREEFGQLLRSPTYRPVEEEPGVWSILCFYVHPAAKRRGVGRSLHAAALEHAVRGGAKAIEAYVSEPADYMGVKRHLQELGFEPVRSAGKRTVMRYLVGAPHG